MYKKVSSEPLGFTRGKPVKRLGLPAGFQQPQSQVNAIWKNVEVYDSEPEEEEDTMKEIVLDAYMALLDAVPVVFKAEVLYDDRPSEISIRLTLVDNMSKLDTDLMRDAANELRAITSGYKPEGANRIILSTVQKEVIDC